MNVRFRLVISSIIIVIVLVYCRNNNADKNLCLVSNLVTRAKGSKQTVYSYPEYFSLVSYNVNQTNSSSHNSSSPSSRYDCTIKMMMLSSQSEKREFHLPDKQVKGWIDQVIQRHNKKVSQCSNTTCPLKAHNIASAWKVVKWNFTADALCALGVSSQLASTHLNTASATATATAAVDVAVVKRKVNVIVFGGSMTLGRGAVGTCCIDRWHKSCVLNFQHMFATMKPARHYCFWFGYLMHWFVHAFPGTEFTFHNLAAGGATSAFMAQEAAMLIRLRNITLLPSDIFILDHSVNDGGAINGVGLELLVRAIYRHVSLSLSLSFNPTIIVLEQYSRPNTPYTHGYRRVAEYYSLPYFSYRELIHNPSAEQVNLFSLILSGGLHVPWPNHMLIADALAAWLSELIHTRCSLTHHHSQSHSQSAAAAPLISDSHSLTDSSSTGTSYGHAMLSRSSNTNANAEVSAGGVSSQRSRRHIVANMPPPLHTQCTRLGQFTCSRHHSDIVYAAAASTAFTPVNLSEYERTLQGWTEYVDYHSSAGWMINIHAPAHNSVLRFPFTIDSNNSDNNSNNNNSNNNSNSDKDNWKLAAASSAASTEEVAAVGAIVGIGIQIKLLRTYSNAGACEFSVCESKPKLIDSLIGRGHELQRVSVPYIYYLKLSADEIINCQSVPAGNRSISVHYLGMDSPHNHNHRGARKVKIYSVKMCFLESH